MSRQDNLKPVKRSAIIADGKNMPNQVVKGEVMASWLHRACLGISYLPRGPLSSGSPPSRDGSRRCITKYTRWSAQVSTHTRGIIDGNVDGGGGIE
jgi:hypothetical protein